MNEQQRLAYHTILDMLGKDLDSLLAKASKDSGVPTAAIIAMVEAQRQILAADHALAWGVCNA